MRKSAILWKCLHFCEENAASQQNVGDSVVWDGERKVGKAFGNIVYTDAANKNMFTGNYCLYNDSTGYSEY